jgi:DNA repair exonuclease SbcCD ATPase subunit
MVLFKTLIIENYYSIGYITYDLVNGLHKLSGANGQGKTSLCSAIAQCLYNKSIKADGVIEDTYNKVTNQPYKITLLLEVNSVNYKIENDRGRNNIYLSRNGIDITPKGIKNQLALIQSIIGLDYSTFISLTYLSQSSMNSVFDLADTNNILHKFFDVDILNFLFRELKSERKDNTKHLMFLQQQASDLEKTISSLTQYEIVDVAPFVAEKYSKLDALNLLLSGTERDKIVVLKSKIDSSTLEYTSAKVPLIKLKERYSVLKEQMIQLEKGKCPLCGSEVSTILKETSDTLEGIHNQSSVIKKELEVMSENIENLKNTLHTIEYSFTTKVQALEREIELIVNKVSLLEEKNKNFSKIKKDLELLALKKKTIEDGIVTYVDKDVFITSALQVITSGSITKQYVASFIYTFNNKIIGLLEYLDIKLIVEVKEVNGKIIYTINNPSGAEIAFGNLSSGERTRVSLIVLLAIVETLEALTNVSINLIIFDELLSVLDTEGVKVLKDILNKYRSNKNTFVVLHHNEIEQDYFDTTVVLKKVRDLTKIERIV